MMKLEDQDADEGWNFDEHADHVPRGAHKQVFIMLRLSQKRELGLV